MSRIGYYMALSLMFFIFSLPVFTIGAASSALYTIVLEDSAGAPSDSLLFRFWQAFKANFGKATLLFVIVAAVGALLGYNFVLMYANEGLYDLFMTIVLLIASFYYLLSVFYVFPLQARYVNPISKTLKNSFLLALARFPVSLLLIVLHIFPFALLFLDIRLAMVVFVILIFIGKSLIAKLEATVLLWAFRRIEG